MYQLESEGRDRLPYAQDKADARGDFGVDVAVLCRGEEVLS